MNEKNILVIFA